MEWLFGLFHDGSHIFLPSIGVKSGLGPSSCIVYEFPEKVVVCGLWFNFCLLNKLKTKNYYCSSPFTIFIMFRTVPTIHIVNPKNTMNHASIFFRSVPLSPLPALRLTFHRFPHIKYINPGMANMISDPKSEPFNPITTSTFVCRIAMVTVDASTPMAVLHPIQSPLLHEPQSNRMKLPHRAEDGVQIGAYSEVGDGEVADDAESESDARDGGRNGIAREVEQDVSLRVLSEHEISAHCA